MQPHYFLIVEDEDDMRWLLVETLRAKGYDCIAVTDGEQALAHLRDFNPPSLIISDWQMPLMNGRKLCQLIRENQNFEKIPIIIYSATDEQIKKNEQESLNFSVVQKEGSLSNLINTIKRLI